MKRNSIKTTFVLLAIMYAVQVDFSDMSTFNYVNLGITCLVLVLMAIDLVMSIKEKRG